MSRTGGKSRLVYNACQFKQIRTYGCAEPDSFSYIPGTRYYINIQGRGGLCMRFLAMAQVGLEPSHTVGCRRGTKVQNRTVGIGHERFRNEAIRDNSRSRSNFTGPNRENTLILWFSVLSIRPTTDNSKEPQAFAFGSVRFCSVPLELHRTEP